MSLGIVSNEEFESELNGGIKIEEIDITRGRGDTLETPEIVRKIIGQDAIENGSKGTNDYLAKYLNVSASSVSAYKNGAHSTTSYHDRDNNLGDFRKKVRNRIFKKANRITVRALDSITDDKLESAKALDLASIARSTSAIMKDMSPDESSSLIQNNQVIIFRPRISEEDEYQVIDVTAE